MSKITHPMKQVREDEIFEMMAILKGDKPVNK